MNRISLTGLIRIELPGHTLRFCDGGFFDFGGETYRSDDAVYGTIGQFQTMSEGVGDIVPAISMTLLPPDETAAVDVSAPGNQTARAILTIAEYDADTGLIVSSETQFDGQVDQTIFTVGKNKKQVSMSIVSLSEQLFSGNIGNTLGPTFHKGNWPGETGQDNATGLSTAVAWGTEKPVSGSSGYGGSRYDAGGIGIRGVSK